MANIAAFRAVKVTTDVGEAETRPYVGVDQPYVDRRKRECPLPIRNFGHTPAFNLVVKTTILKPTPEGPPIPHLIGIIDPNNTLPATVKLTDGEFAALDGPGQKFRIKVEILYSQSDGIKGWSRTAEYYCPNGQEDDARPCLHIAPGTAKEEETEAPTS